jgi:hypothetical protein
LPRATTSARLDRLTARIERLLDGAERQRIAERCAGLHRSNNAAELAKFIERNGVQPRGPIGPRDVLVLFQTSRHTAAMALRQEIASAISFVLRLRIGAR